MPKVCPDLLYLIHLYMLHSHSQIYPHISKNSIYIKEPFIILCYHFQGGVYVTPAFIRTSVLHKNSTYHNLTTN